jgi:radical SAM superfamily enzyme YgiQ (UPF0313 family)
MSLKVLFTHSYFLSLDPKQEETQTPYAPLATLYAAALIREQGYTVDLFDVQFCRSPLEIKQKLETFAPDVLVIYDDGFNYLTKMCLTNMREAAWRMQELAKEYKCAVIVSGSDASDQEEDYLFHGADYIIIGEAEQTLVELLNAFNENEDKSLQGFQNLENLEKIKGIAYLEEGAVKRSAARAVLKDLDTLPKPAWDLIDLEPYKNTWMSRHGFFSINMVTTRGCPYKCNWCAKPIYGNRYNAHSPGYIVDLIEDMQKHSDFTHIWFADDIFGLKPGWLKEFAALIAARGIRIKYKIQSRADLLLEPESIQYLAASGCETVWMGAESGSQKILDAMDKGIKVEEITEACTLLKKYGIKPSLFLQFGYPGETMDDIRKTIDMVKNTMPEDIGISVSYPLPGTGFYEKVKSELNTKANWNDSDDLDLMFKNTYSREFYKELHRYVHYTYRSKQAGGNIRELFRGRFSGALQMKRVFAFPYYKLAAGKHKMKLSQLESDAEKFL